MPLTLEELEDLGFEREYEHPMVTAYKKDVMISSTHYKRMRIFSDRDTMIVFNNIHKMYDYPSCNPKNRNTGLKIYHKQVTGEEATKYNMQRFGFL